MLLPIKYVCDTASPAEDEEIEQVCVEFMKVHEANRRSQKAGEFEAEKRAASSRPYLRTIAKIGFNFLRVHFPFSGLNLTLMTSND